MAHELDGARAQIVGVELTDPALVAFQTEYATTLERMSAAARDMQAGGDRSDVPAMEAGLRRLQRAADDNSKLVDRINAYCEGPGHEDAGAPDGAS